MLIPGESSWRPKRRLTEEVPIDTQLDTSTSNSLSRSSTDATNSSFGSLISRTSTCTTLSSSTASSPPSSTAPASFCPLLRAEDPPKVTQRNSQPENCSSNLKIPSGSTKRRRTTQNADSIQSHEEEEDDHDPPLVQDGSLYDALPLLSSLSIRFLRLLPAALSDSPLISELHVAKLDACPDFEGLSYTWDSPIEKTDLPLGSIRVSGHHVAITGNLDHALRHLRYPDRSRHLWVDSLCIDQQQPKERRYQIEIMEQIYSTATRVLAWLGEDTLERDGKYVFDFCDLVEKMGRRPHYKAVARHREQWTDYKDLSRIFAGRRYFKRRWIIQEICHANEVLVVCGTRSASLPVFSAALQKLPASRRPLEKMKEFCTTISHLRQALQDWRQQDLHSSQTSTLSDFIWMLQRFHEFKCSDDRDRLYAIASLWKGFDVPECRLAAEYEISCEELYLQFAHRLIAAYLPDPRILNQTLTIAASQACNGRYDSNDQPALPSWVVDWRLDPASRIGPDDVAGTIDVHAPRHDRFLKELTIRTRCYGKIVEASGHYRDWVLLTCNGIRLPGHRGALADEDFVDTLGKMCPALAEGDVLCQPVSTYWARKGHCGDAAIVIRPIREGHHGAYQLVGRCPLDLFWNEAEGPGRTTLSIPTDDMTVTME